MSFTIHSIGDSAFLEQILIAIRLVTGNGNFKMMIGVGLLISCLLVCLRTLFTNSERIDYHQIFIGWIVYQSLFVPTTTVTIQNAYTGEVSVVDKVPLGVGAAAGIISTIGHGLTKIFDTSFGVIAPGITKANFAESLSLLNDVRRQVHNPAVFEALDKAGGGTFDFHGSWHNYIRECTLTKIDINSTSLTNLMRQPIDQALRFDSKLYTTQLKTGAISGHYGSPLNCTDAYNQLAQLTNITSQQVEKEIGKTLGFGSLNRLSTFSQITNALQAVGASRTSAASFVKNALLEPLYYEAASGRYKDWQDYSSALMVNQAIQQRNTRWAAEQTMFMTIVRPMLTFFEGFIYAITPLMAFMIVMGSFGIQLLGKYLQTIFWTQLWMPVMSIINMFIHVAATRALAPVVQAEAGLSSMYALDRAGDILQHWIATGGMLAAATPVISLFIVSGSTHAMSGLVGRISTSEGIDTGIAAPAAVQQSAVVAAGSGYAHNQHSGMIAAGTESLVPNYNFGSTLNHGLSSVSSQLNQSSQSFNQTLGKAINEGGSQENTYARISDLGRSFSAQNSEASDFVTEKAKSFSEQAGISSDHTDFIRGAIGTHLTGAINAESSLGDFLKNLAPKVSDLIGKSGLDMKVEGSVGANTDTSSSYQDSTKWESSNATNFVKGIKAHSGYSQTLTNQMAQHFSDQNRQGTKEVWGESLSKTLANSASEVKTLSQTYSEMSRLQTQIGTATQSDLRSLAASVGKNNLAARHLNDQFQTHANSSVRREANDLSNHFRDFNGMDPLIADTSGKIVALTNTANFSPEEKIQALQGVTKAIQMSLGYHPDLDENHSPIQPSTSGSKPTSLEKEITQAVGQGPSTRSVEDIRTQANTSVPTDGEHVRSRATRNRNTLENQGEQANKTLSTPHIRKAQSNLLHSVPEMSRSASTWGKWDNATGWLCRRVDQLGGALFAGSEASARAFNNSVEQLSTMTPEQRSQFLSTLGRGEEALAKFADTSGTALVVGAATLGTPALTAAATGYIAADKWLSEGTNLSEAAKEMTLGQKGIYYATAFSAALREGPKAATRFMEEHGQELKATMAETSQNRYGLTPAQSAVYAESFDTNRERMEEAVKGLKMEYAKTHHPREEISFDENGQPLLGKQDAKFTDQLVNIIQNATTAGDMAGSYLSSVRNYNIAARKLED